MEVEDWHTYFVGKLAWLVHNAKPCGTDTIKGVINWSSKSVKTFGHTFLKHGQNNFKKLQEVARQKIYHKVYGKMIKKQLN
ncbi:MAG: hypothetical protein J6568_04465 [Snodgrassella sp.]|nr:hypothetical protein [Snodgrassella sp.]